MREDPNLNKRKRISPVGVIGIIFAVIVIGLLVSPSAKDKRLTQAKEYLAREFPIVSDDSIKPLLGSHLLTNDKFIYDAGRKECAILIFRPDPTSPYSADAMMTEVSRPLQYYYSANTSWGKVPVAILLAPDESSTGWTIFAKIWIAKVLQKQKVDDLKQLGLELSTSPAALVRIKKIWAKEPPKIQARATQILEENRKVAKQFRKTPRFYRNKVTYAISNQHDMSDFIGAFEEAHPEQARKGY
jgi:hypothetical protein